MNNNFLLDCTLRDGGYYNAWDFDSDLIAAYLKAMDALPVDMVEIGFRFMPGGSNKFKGGCAYCTDAYINSLEIPNDLRLAIMVNGSDLTKYPDGVTQAVDRLFGPAETSPVELVRIAVHVHKVKETLPAITRLNEIGYKTTINLMQIAGLTRQEIEALAKICSGYPIDILYFADSLGSMIQEDINFTVDALRTHWKGELGFHAHNNMERGLSNCIRAMEQGVTWVDSTVLGMGRGPGNARTEYLAIEFETRLLRKINYTPLLELIEKHFKPLQKKYDWGPNPYYYMAGKYGIHPTYVQEMIGDSRYGSDDILGVIEHLNLSGGKHYSLESLEAGRNFYSGEPRGTWAPKSIVKGRKLLILGAGPSVKRYKFAIEKLIQDNKPLVFALNTQSEINQDLIDYRLACHPIRLLADYRDLLKFPQPLIIPKSMLPDEIKEKLSLKEILDYGIGIHPDTFIAHNKFCILPNSLVIAYALAVSNSGEATRIFLAGFDGYTSDDPRTLDMENLLSAYKLARSSIELCSITPTNYKIPMQSIYSLEKL